MLVLLLQSTTRDVPNMCLAGPELQSTRKAIARGTMHVEVYERDLLTEAQQTEFGSKPNYEANVAGVRLPWKVWLGSLVGADKFGELVILSKKR